MPIASALNCTKAGLVAAGMVGLECFAQSSHADDGVLAESKVFFEKRAALLGPVSLAALDRLVVRVRSIAPEMVSARGLFRDEQPEMILILGQTDDQEERSRLDLLSQDRAEAVKGYLASRGIDPYRLRIEELPAGRAAGRCDSAGAPGQAACLQDDRRVTVRLVTFPR